MEDHFFQQHPGTTPSSPSAELNGPQGGVKKKQKTKCSQYWFNRICPTLIQEMLSNSIASKFKISVLILAWSSYMFISSRLHKVNVVNFYS